MTAFPDTLRGDGPCDDCGTVDNPVWFTDSVFWNEVVRFTGHAGGILCINCFVILANRAGFRPTGWRLAPDWHWETIAEHAIRYARGLDLSGREWVGQPTPPLDLTGVPSDPDSPYVALFAEPDVTVWQSEQDDPAPTTGAPEEHYFPEGCGCHIREDPEWGDVYAHPPEGCRVHTPWAFPGYSLATVSDEYL